MAKKRNGNDNRITLTDGEGTDHAFDLLQFFQVGRKDYALLHPAKAPKHAATILRVVLGKDGDPESFRDLSEAEFKKCLDVLECTCECEGTCDEAECCGGENHAAPKRAAKKPAAKKAAVKKPAAKKVAAKPAAKKAAAKPAAKKVAKKVAKKAAAKKTARRAVA